MDNAPYHSKVVEKLPNSNSSKLIIQKCLKDQNINFDISLKKKDLWDFAKPYLNDAKQSQKYEIDEILARKN